MSLGVAEIDALGPTERAQYLGNGLYPRIATLIGEALAGKVTGMLLEMSTAELVGLLADAEALRRAVSAAVAALPPDMLDFLGETPPPGHLELMPDSPVANPSPSSVMCGPSGGDTWADCDDDDESLPTLDDMFASAERKRVSRTSSATVHEPAKADAMELDDGFVCEWDFAQMATQPAEELSSFIAERLAEPQVRIMRAVVELLGVHAALTLLRDTEHCVFNGGMIVEETGKPRTPGGICKYPNITPDAVVSSV